MKHSTYCAFQRAIRSTLRAIILLQGRCSDQINDPYLYIGCQAQGISGMDVFREGNNDRPRAAFTGYPRGRRQVLKTLSQVRKLISKLKSVGNQQPTCKSSGQRVRLHLRPLLCPRALALCHSRREEHLCVAGLAS